MYTKFDKQIDEIIAKMTLREKIGQLNQVMVPKTKEEIEAAKAVGNTVAKRAIEKGITEVVFDRGGYIYHGRVKALAEGAREGGLVL